MTGWNLLEVQDYGFASVGRLLSQQTLHFVRNDGEICFKGKIALWVASFVITLSQ
ncbi:hypothetical protein [Helicobacter rodentium]|uniref:hypothetical protein n=1 Tax=Helicobacter rodentium TaxID=59617 RepID=UPI002355B219|nr:hypothetical protein [Helicobacter rodentium]